MSVADGVQHGSGECAESLGARTVTSLADVPVGAWDDLARDAGFYMSHSWLRDAETHRRSETAYVVVEEPGGRLVAALPVHLVHDETNSRYDSRPLGGSYPEFVLGSRRGYRSSPLLRRSDGVNTERALTLLGEQVHGLVGEQPARMWFVPEPDVAATRALGVAMGRPRTVSAGLDVEAWVPVGAGGLDELIASQPSRHRTKLRRERRTFLAQGYRISFEELGAVTSEAGRLLAQLEGKYGSTRPVSDWVSYYERLSSAEESGEVLACRGPDDGLLGFVHFYEFGDGLWARTCGLDYSRLRDAFEYFNLAIFELVELAAERGLRRLHLGMESLDAKQRHGAVLERLDLVTFEVTAP